MYEITYIIYALQVLDIMHTSHIQLQKTRGIT